MGNFDALNCALCAMTVNGLTLKRYLIVAIGRKQFHAFSFLHRRIQIESNSPGGGIGPKQKTAYEKDKQRQY